MGTYYKGGRHLSTWVLQVQMEQKHPRFVYIYLNIFSCSVAQVQRRNTVHKQQYFT